MPPLRSVGTRRTPGEPLDRRLKVARQGLLQSRRLSSHGWGKQDFVAKNESSPPGASMRPTVRRPLDLEGGGLLTPACRPLPVMSHQGQKSF